MFSSTSLSSSANVFLLLPILLLLGSAEVSAQVDQRNVVLHIDTSSPVATISDNFICATLDWWPPEKCDYGYCSWGRASLLNLDLTSKKFINAVRGLSPLLVRVGGSLQDQIIYDIGANPGPCLPLSRQPSAMFGFTGGCLNMSRWSELNSFFTQTGALVAFGLNALYGRRNGFSGAWSSSNSRDLIQFSADHGFPVIAWELGNELSGSGVGTSVSAKQYAADVKELRRLVDEVYGSSSIKPLVVAPDGFWDYGWFREFLQDTGANVVDVVSHHIYNLGPGVDSHLVDKILDPSYLNQEAGTFRGFQNLLRGTGSVAWVGEAGGAYNSGHHNVTDRFVFSFWYLDELGMAAVYDTKVYCRQSLIGGNYGLVSNSFTLNPDYYSALLWKKLMGNKVFSATASNAPYLRTYAHCLKDTPGGVAILLINLSNSTTYSVELSVMESDRKCRCGETRRKKLAGRGVNVERYEYHLTAPNGELHSPVMLLNGEPLVAYGEDGNIPTLKPIQTSSSLPVSVQPYSIVFAAIPNAGLHACI